MQEEVLANLKKIQFLASQSNEALLGLAAKAKEKKFPKGAIIINEGDETNSLYFILSGKVRIYGTDENDKEIILSDQQAGECFGELSLLSSEPRSATVKTLQTTRCSVISQTDFINWSQLHPEVAIALLEVLTEKVRYLTARVKQLAFSNAYQRTVQVLMELASKEGDIWVIRPKPTQTELANRVGAARESVNRFINGLIEGGYLVVERNSYKIPGRLPARF